MFPAPSVLAGYVAAAYLTNGELYGSGLQTVLKRRRPYFSAPLNQK